MSENLPYLDRGQLILPEYGRNVQKMVEHAVSITDRAERTRCAKTIINIMGNIFPHLRDIQTFKHMLWDHLAIMSDYKLDIDYPFDIIKPELRTIKPEPLQMNSSRIKFMHYGRTLQEFVSAASEMEDGEERRALLNMIAIQMRKSYAAWNKDGLEPQKIFDDLRILSEGKINLTAETFKIESNEGNGNSMNRRLNNNNNKKRNSNNRNNKR